MQSLGEAFEASDLNGSRGVLCNLYRQPVAPKLVSQQFPPPHHTATFHETARTLGFKTGTASLTSIAGQKRPPPRDQPSDGLIQLDGKDIRHLAANELRATFGVVPQETVLFAGTLYDNLVMAHPHASFEDVIVACKAAEIHEVIEKLPEGYQTEIGERGTGLSGGQKQRIAIARALLKKPKILIFDEAVSNLDTQTAEHFAKTINKLKGQVTMLFITHQIPRGLQVDEVFGFGEEGHMTRMGVVEDEG